MEAWSPTWAETSKSAGHVERGARRRGRSRADLDLHGAADGKGSAGVGRAAIRRRGVWRGKGAAERHREVFEDLDAVLTDPDVVEPFLVCIGVAPTPEVPAASRAPPWI